MDKVEYIHAKTSLMTRNVHYPQNLKGYEEIEYNTEQMSYSKEAPIDQVVNQPAWAKDTYSNGILSRIADDINALF